MFNRPTAPQFVWHQSGPLDLGTLKLNNAQYTFIPAGGTSKLDLHRHLFGEPNVVVPGNTRVASAGFKQVGMQWYQMELSMFQGNIQLWIDGKPVIDFTDPEPLPPGHMGIFIGPFTDKSITVMYFDAISVCGLSAPFVSMPSPVPAVVP